MQDLKQRRRHFQQLNPTQMDKKEYNEMKSFCFYPIHVKGTAETPMEKHNTHVARTKR